MILIENGPDGAPALFDRPSAWIRADEADQVPAALAALRAAQAEGRWIAGFASYELGYALEPRLGPLMPPARDMPLLMFGLFDAPEPGGPFLQAASAKPGTLGAAQADWTAEDHGAATRATLDLIAAGDIYQANLTMTLRTRWSGDPAGLYARLRDRQPTAHGACLILPGLPPILSRSPELFFALDGAGGIETLPMKGTAPRDPAPARDVAFRDALAASVKDRAENLMIVDLLRNDISRVCRPGSVRVPDLFQIESYTTVHQMVSRVTGALMPGTGLDDILRALFPCGSITGAPKIRAMEVIRALEPAPRGIYCGTIGWMAPDGRAAFNVAIRTLVLNGDGTASLGVGGGIVADSTPQREYEEALWKARFADLTRG